MTADVTVQLIKSGGKKEDPVNAAWGFCALSLQKANTFHCIVPGDQGQGRDSLQERENRRPRAAMETDAGTGADQIFPAIPLRSSPIFCFLWGRLITLPSLLYFYTSGPLYFLLPQSETP